MIIDTLVDQDKPRRVEIDSEVVAAHGLLQAAEAQRTLLEESRGKASLAPGREGPDRVTLEENDGRGQVNLEGHHLQGEDAGIGLAADLVLHVV